MSDPSIETPDRPPATTTAPPPADAPVSQNVGRLLLLVPQPMLELDTHGRIIRANPPAKRLFHPAEVEGQNWLQDCIVPEDREAEAAALQETLATGSNFDATRRVRLGSDSGPPRVLMVRATALKHGDGESYGALLYAEDTSDSMQSPGALHDTLAALHAHQFALDASAIVAVTDRRGLIRHVNPQFCAISKYSPDELLGQDHRILNSGYHRRDFFKSMWSTIGSGKVWRGDIRNRAKDGSYYWVATTIVPFLDENEQPFQYVAIRFEITERKLAERALERTVRDLAVAREEEARRAEALQEARDHLEAANHRIREEQAKLVQAEKLSSIGMLASGVAHEINNPLAGVMNCVRALSEGTAKPSRRQEYFRTAQDGLERIQQIVHGLLDYSRQRPVAYSTVDAREVVQACERLISPYLRKNRVELNQNMDATWIRGDRSRLMQALINVLLNAIYVSPSGGTVDVSVVRSADHIGLAVRDHGPGMANDELQRACDPFFTTKPEGEGTGLGLAVTAAIIRAHAGDIEFRVHGRDGDPDSGTTVLIWLPAAGEQGANGA